MRFSDQYREYAKGNPVMPIQCYYMKRSGAGRIAQRVNITLSPQQCAHFRIWEPRLLRPERAARIEEWGRKQAMGEWP